MELIPIGETGIGGVTVQTVNARELHGFLGSKQEFANWIKNRIDFYDFVENRDFVIIGKIVKNPSGGRPLKEYYLTISMGKEIAMIERNAKGRKVRQYFIDCERKLKEEANPIKLLNNPSVMREYLLTYSERVLQLEQQVANERAVKEEVKQMASEMKEKTTKMINDLSKKLHLDGNFVRARGIPFILEYLKGGQATWVKVGKELSRISRELGLEIAKVPDAHHGQVGAYRKEAIEWLKLNLDEDENYLSDLRKQKADGVDGKAARAHSPAAAYNECDRDLEEATAKILAKA